jgi:hypothetical protein
MSEQTKTANAEVQNVKRGRGRPKGSKNKPKIAPTVTPVQA